MSSDVGSKFKSAGQGGTLTNTHDGYAPQDPDALLTEQQAATLLGVSVRGLQGWRLRGGGPSFVKCGRLVRYRRRDLTAWMDSRTVSHTSQISRDD